MTLQPAEPYPLVPADSVGAILVTPDGRFLLQRRDDVPHIWYPGCWGLFGGGIDPGESELDALRRELREEAGIAFDAATEFTRFDFDFGFVGDGMIARTYFEVPIEAAAVAGLTIREGAELALFDGATAVAMPNMIGYDGFALYLYMQRGRVTRPPY